MEKQFQTTITRQKEGFYLVFSDVVLNPMSTISKAFTLPIANPEKTCQATSEK